MADFCLNCGIPIKKKYDCGGSEKLYCSEACMSTYHSKAYRKTPKGKAAEKRAREKKKELGKRNASAYVHKAIKSGRLIKPNKCSVCGKTNCKIQGHHRDYDKPLKVDWLCISCHVKVHHNKLCLLGGG